MSKSPKPATVSPSKGVEVKNPETFGSDPMHLHQTMIDVLKETTTNTAALKSLETAFGDVKDKLDRLRIRFAYVAGGAAVALFLFGCFGTFLWWLVGTQVTDLKNELVRRLPAPAISSTAK